MLGANGSEVIVENDANCVRSVSTRGARRRESMWWHA